MITQIDVTAVENSFCNSKNNTWNGAMLLDKKLLSQYPDIILPDNIYESFDLMLHYSICVGIEIYCRKCLDEIT